MLIASERHPHLPKVDFTPPGREWVRGYFGPDALGGAEGELAERLRARGLSFEEVMNQRAAEVEAKAPGVLTIWVEVGKARVPTPEQFDELLAHTARIAQITGQVNPPSSPA